MERISGDDAAVSCSTDNANRPLTISVIAITKATSIRTEDVLATLQHLGVVRTLRSENGKSHAIVIPEALIERTITQLKKRVGPVFKEKALHWAPLSVYVPKRDKWSIKAKRQPTK